MEIVATSLIAVLGTLLGSTLTYVFQRRTSLRAEQFTRVERLRQERIDAYSAYAGALTEYRRGQMDRWFARNDGRAVEAETLHEMRREAQRLRTAAMEAMFRAELLTHSTDLHGLGRQALKEIDRIPDARSRDELEPIRDTSRASIYDFVAASRQHIPGTADGGPQ
ncbi:hypothetical protein ACIBI4_27670 [Streptomyces sp. NPDC050418]|uniref:hypothetical protein n=1 Tax=Streptomyces sp. NPDC050418 TaxID=3365612 RepID=UPI00379CEF4C